MKKVLGWVAVLGAVSVLPAACNNSRVNSGATGDETPEESATPGETPTVEPTATPAVDLHEFRFVAFGDTGDGYDEQYPVASAVSAKCAADGCDFGMLLG